MPIGLTCSGVSSALSAVVVWTEAGFVGGVALVIA